MAAFARFVTPVFLSLVSVSFLWGCSSSSTNNNQDAAADSAKMDSTSAISSDLPLGTGHDSLPLPDGPASTDGPFAIDGPSTIADAVVLNDLAGKDVGIGSSTESPCRVIR